ncbi:alkane 1-monooxygenase [Rhodococcus kronopolitis]|uniref:Alkane 1-monooxygenase n=1 Tax=Rhodococcus kronopolitis TaxID=1460226 RepID=A0ABV9FTQ5_9NOCA
MVTRVNEDSVAWRDPKRYLWPLGLAAPLGPFIAWALVHTLGLGLFWAFGAFLWLIFIPFIDLVTGPDNSNPPEEAMAALERNRYYRWCLYLYLPLQYLGLFFGCYFLVHEPMGSGERAALAVTLGVSAAIGINVGHELVHRLPGSERTLGKWALAQSFYGHFCVEHKYGHHVRVATPEDFATARFGESFWAFLPRSIFGGIRSSWRLERARLERHGQRVWSRGNNLLVAWSMSVVCFAPLILLFGWGLLPWIAIQAAIAILLLESANYLEHYGLLRQKRPNGNYERITPQHSWNSDQLCSNLFLYHLQRHSDHHANPGRRYQLLRSFKESPQLPSGYVVMIILSLFPPLWRRVMDHRVLAHYGGDLTLINVCPRKRERVVRRYGTGAYATS